jgi:glycosyltransferase involved in cell wall biosynthesis
MGAGTPVIAYFGGGYKESVVDGRTGIFFKELSAGSLIKAIKKLDEAGIKEEECIAQANKFSKHRFIKEFNAFVNKIAKTKE